MKSPITVLWNNIVHTFENINSSSLSTHQAAIESGKVSPDIICIYDNEKVSSPFVDYRTKEINIPEAYLSYLWAFMYATLVMYEEGIQKRLINGTFNQDIGLEFNTPLLQRAKGLFDWSISLTSIYSDWDTTLPNPKIHNNQEEKFWAERVNAFFQDAVAFVMFHEFAHLTQNHESFFLFKRKEKLQRINELHNKKKKTKKEEFELKELTQELNERINIENEADKLAFDALISSNDDNERLLKYLSILSIYLAHLLMAKTPEDIKKLTHPDTDNRIFNFLQQLNFTTEEDEFYCQYFCVFVIRFFFLKHNIDYPVCEFETAQEALTYYFDELDEFKGEH